MGKIGKIRGGRPSDARTFRVEKGALRPREKIEGKRGARSPLKSSASFRRKLRVSSDVFRGGGSVVSGDGLVV